MTLKSCGSVARLSPWSDSAGSKGALKVAWVKIGNIPVDKRCNKKDVFVCGLVGAPLDINMFTENLPSFVRDKLDIGVLEAYLHLLKVFWESTPVDSYMKLKRFLSKTL